MRKSNLIKRLAAVACGLALGIPMLFAQNTITVTGTVTDAQKEPIIGASVMQSGTTTVGTATDVDGNFTLVVPEGATLEISSIGFETRKVKATEKMNIVLVEDTELLNETVVVAAPRTSPPPRHPTALTPSRARFPACRSCRTAESPVSSTPTSPSAVTATR